VKLGLKLLGLLLFVLMLLAGWVWQKIDAEYTLQPQILQIPHGAGLNRVAHLLEKQGVVDSALIFRLAARLADQTTQVKEGEYAFGGVTSISKVLQKLVQGQVVLHQVTVPEGLRTDDVLHLLATRTKTDLAQWQSALKVVLADKMEVEGYLLPETYSYTRPLNIKDFLLHMVQAQQKVLEEVAPESWEQVRIMASIIEKETALDAERPLVSAAIHNRLRLGMPLQMDPTVIYGIWRRDGIFSGNIHKKDLQTDTPWNSYTRRGLPPTPICNPGAASLRAAAAPANVRYLYFVADGSGGHAFASTLQEHQRNVKKWLRLQRRR